MARTSVHEALVLSVRSSGESNREAAFLTAEEGIIRATVFGGPKSKLRAHVESMHRGTLFLYRDPVRDSRKVVDFDVRNWRPMLRELLERSLAASAIAETILASHGGGGAWAEALALVDDSLDALELADEDGSRRTLTRFLWKWADILGARPETDSCPRCACRPADDEVVWYSRRDASLICSACAGKSPGHGEYSTDGGIEVSPGARRWLAATEATNAAQALRIRLDATSAVQARRLATAALAEALGKRLRTWDGWDG
jgi:DNA repair protein RecO (recombination protein O)